MFRESGKDEKDSFVLPMHLKQFWKKNQNM